MFEREFESLAEEEGYAALAYQVLSNEQRARLLDKFGPRVLLKKLLGAEESLKTVAYLQSRAKPEKLWPLLCSGDYQVHGKTKEGGAVFWFRMPGGVQVTERPIEARLYHHWMILWHIRALTGSNGKGAFVVYDRDRASLDFDMKFLTTIAEFF